MITKEIKGITKRVKRLFFTKDEKRHELVGAPKLWKMKQEFQINFLKNQNLQQTDSLLDIGCGTLRGGIPIIEFLDSEKYCGIEVRENVLNEAKKELKDQNLQSKKPRLVCFNDFQELNLEAKFDVIFSFSVLFHLEDKIAASCFEFVARHLSKEGVFYANVNLGSRNDGSWQGFPVVCRSLDFYQDLCASNGMKLKTIGKLKDLGHHSGRELEDNQTMLKIKLA